MRVEDGGKFFELNEFDGASKGFKFYVMQFKTLEDAIEHYKALKQDDAILTLVNRQLNFNMRTKAKNQITNEDVAKKLLSREETLLINVDEARQFVPGEREVTSVGGLYKAIDTLKDQVKEAREAGDPELASSLKEKIKVLYAKLQERKDRPLRLGLIGAGKFAAMYLAQVPKTPGIHLAGIADLAPEILGE